MDKFWSRLRPQIMVAIMLLSAICMVAMLANGGDMKEIATAGVTGIILLAREVITQDTDNNNSGGATD